MKTSSIRIVFLVLLGLFPHCTYANGWETGGGQPESVRFKLLALRSIASARTCKIAEAQVKPYTLDKLEDTIRNTKLRMSDKPLTQDGGIVYGKVERTDNGDLVIAIDLAEWRKYPNETSSTGLDWEIWNIHEYLRVLGLGKEDDNYNVSTKFVQSIHDCGIVTNPLNYKTITFVRQSLFNTSSTKQRTLGNFERPRDPYNSQPIPNFFASSAACAKYFPDLVNEVAADKNRATLAWYRTQKAAVIEDIRAKLGGLQVIAIDEPELTVESTYISTYTLEPAQLDNNCPGAISIIKAQLNAYVTYPSKEVVASDENYYDKTFSIAVWNGSLEDSQRYLKDLQNIFQQASLEAVVHCESWRTEIAKTYGANLKLSDCQPVRNTTDRDTMTFVWGRLEPQYPPAHKVHFTGTGTAFWQHD